MSLAFSSWSLTGRTSPAPSSGDTFGSRGDAAGGGGQAHRRHAGGELRWGRQLQQGDVIVEVLGVVVWVTDDLKGVENTVIHEQYDTTLKRGFCVMPTLTLEIVLT